MSHVLGKQSSLILGSRARVLAALAATAGVAALMVLALGVPERSARATPVATNDAEYALCGRVFPDPHAYWPSPQPPPQESPFAKGNADCRSFDFLQYREMVDGMRYLEDLFPRFIRFYRLEKAFGDGDDCATSTKRSDLCSAGLPRGAGRVKSDLWMIRVTDERVPNKRKKFFVFPLSIHGIERAGAEAGVRATEDLATWAYCEARKNKSLKSNGVTNCGQEGKVPHPLLETQPKASVTAGSALERSAIFFVFPNPDGWRRGDLDNLTRFYQRYNGNGVDLNRDWPTLGYTYRPYTPWSEPESRHFGRVLKGIRKRWTGGIDLHGQLIDRAFSFTLLGASERDYSKNQRILQTVRGAWRDAEKRFEWADAYIKDNQAPESDPRMYGVQWGTVWDTIDYTVTGSLGDWIDSPIGLGADGIDNEMSFSHLSNCGTGSCYQKDFEQLHVDGNKSLIYSMVNFSLRPEDRHFEAPGKIGYIYDPTKKTNPGRLETPPPTKGLDPQPDISGSLHVGNNWKFEFRIKGRRQGFYNGGVEGKATSVNIGGASADSLNSLVLEQYRPDEETPGEDNGCGADGDDWGEVNRYYNQSSIYLQSGQAVHANSPQPGRWRICVTGGTGTRVLADAFVDLDITFSREKAWPDPGQRPYSATNMRFFRDLRDNVDRGQLKRIRVGDVLAGRVDLTRFTSLVIADDPFPGYHEPIPKGPAQEGKTIDNPGAGTAPCAGGEDAPPTCRRDYEFDVRPTFNNQKLIVRLRSPDTGENDWDLFVQRQSRISGEWFTVGSSTTPTGNEEVTVLTPPGGHYRARVVNWAGTVTDKLEIKYSNKYAGPPVRESKRTQAELRRWGRALRRYTRTGGNLVLTDGAIKNLAYMDVVPRGYINNFSVYAGFIGFTRDGEHSTYDDPLARRVDQPGAAEGPQHRHQTYEPVPIGFAIQNAEGADFNASPVWAVDQVRWEKLGGRTVGITTADQVTLGEMRLGLGRVRLIGALLPMPSEQYYHPYGLADYALTYTGYQVFNNTLQLRCPWRGKLKGNHVVGAAGRDVLRGTPGRDIICGRRGKDVIRGLGGNDVIIGGRGSDDIRAGAGDDIVGAGLRDDVLWGGRGKDSLRGYKGSDRVHGGSGEDAVKGGRGKDFVGGGKRADVLRGGPRRDRLRAGGGNDRLFGGRHRDSLDGGSGRDACTGGSGRDRLRRCES